MKINLENQERPGEEPVFYDWSVDDRMRVFWYRYEEDWETNKTAFILMLMNESCFYI